MKKQALVICSLLACACLAGGAYTVVTAAAETETVDITAITESNFYMSLGASVRKAETYDELGMRFEVNMDKDIYEKFTANEAYTDVHYGVLIAPQSYNAVYPLNNEQWLNEKYNWRINDGDEYAFEVSSGRKEIINLATRALHENKKDSTIVSFNGGVVNMNKENLLTEYVGIGYVCYTQTVGETTETHYKFAAANDNVRSMVYVAQRAIEVGESGSSFLQQSYLTDEVKAVGAEFTMEYYLQQADGSYALSETVTRTAADVADLSIADKAAMELKEIDGYTYIPHKDEKISGAVFAQNKQVLRAYYAKDDMVQKPVVFSSTSDIQVVGEKAYNITGNASGQLLTYFTAPATGETNTYNVTLPKINYTLYESAGYTLAYAGSGTRFELDTFSMTFANNVAYAFSVQADALGQYWLCVDGVKKVTVSEAVATGAEGLSFNIVCIASGNQILVVTPGTSTVDNGTYTYNYAYEASVHSGLKTNKTTEFTMTTGQDGSGTAATWLGVNATTKNAELCTGTKGAWWIAFPKFAFNSYMSTSFTVTPGDGNGTNNNVTALYYDATNGVAFNGAAITVSTKTTENGAVKVYFNGAEKYTLASDVASGETALKLAVIAAANYQVATISPITGVKTGGTFDHNTIAVTATTTSENAQDAPAIAANASLGRIIYFYNTASGNVGGTAPAGYQLTLGAINYAQHESVVFELALSYAGTITIGENTFAITNGQVARMMMKAETDGSVAVYFNNVKRATLTQAQANGEEGFAFGVTRTAISPNYQALIIKSITVR